MKRALIAPPRPVSANCYTQGLPEERSYFSMNPFYKKGYIEIISPGKSDDWTPHFLARVF
jgi:hypothetical protein